MPQQETLTPEPVFNPMDHGLWRRFVDAEGRIVEAAWLRACAAGEFVGTCRRCGDYLIPARPDHVSGSRTDYEATCRRRSEVVVKDGIRHLEGCGWRCNAPSGVVSRKSMRWSEQPRGSRA